jgi:DNA-binding response OmpR family regulator
MRALRDATADVFLITVGLVYLVGVFLVGAVLMGDGTPDFGQDLSHEEFMQLSSREAKALRICQRDELFEELWQTRGSKKANQVYASLTRAQRKEGQPTMPKFVDPGDPPSFQETMWKKGYKCHPDHLQALID